MLLHRLRQNVKSFSALVVTLLCAGCCGDSDCGRVIYGEKDVYVSPRCFASIHCGDALQKVSGIIGHSLRHCLTVNGRHGEVRVYSTYLDCGNKDNGLAVYLVFEKNHLSELVLPVKDCFKKIADCVAVGMEDDYDLAEVVRTLPQTSEVKVLQEIKGKVVRNSVRRKGGRPDADIGLSMVMAFLSPAFMFRTAMDRKRNDACLQKYDAELVALGMTKRAVTAFFGNPHRTWHVAADLIVDEHREKETLGFISRREQYSPIYVLYRAGYVIAVVSSARLGIEPIFHERSAR